MECNDEHLGISISYFRRKILILFTDLKALCGEDAVRKFCKILVRVYQNTRCHFTVSAVRTSDATLLPCPPLWVFSELLITSEFYKNVVPFRFK